MPGHVQSNPHGRKRITNQEGVYSYHQGYIFWNGAEIYALQQPWSYPIYQVEGAGVLAGTLAVLQPPQVRQNLSLPTMALQGTPVGSYYLAPLYDPSGGMDSPDLY